VLAKTHSEQAIMNNIEFEKGKAFIIIELIDYVPNSISRKVIIEKTTGNVAVVSFDIGAALAEKTSPYDTFVQIIDGKAEIAIDGMPRILGTGDSIVIPAHSRNTIKAAERFKMVLTIIKSGIDEVADIV
jgi:quercetin dioxygenase-like cupin family protein